jgi:hypothetical protein
MDMEKPLHSNSPIYPLSHFAAVAEPKQLKYQMQRTAASAHGVMIRTNETALT